MRRSAMNFNELFTEDRATIVALIEKEVRESDFLYDLDLDRWYGNADYQFNYILDFAEEIECNYVSFEISDERHPRAAERLDEMSEHALDIAFEALANVVASMEELLNKKEK